jgi:hypothetical protein
MHVDSRTRPSAQIRPSDRGFALATACLSATARIVITADLTIATFWPSFEANHPMVHNEILWGQMLFTEESIKFLQKILLKWLSKSALDCPSPFSNMMLALSPLLLFAFDGEPPLILFLKRIKVRVPNTFQNIFEFFDA